MKTKKKSQQAAPQFAVCIDNSGYPASLELRKIYRVLRDEEAAQDGDCGLSTKVVRIIFIPRAISWSLRYPRPSSGRY